MFRHQDDENGTVSSFDFMNLKMAVQRLNHQMEALTDYLQVDFKENSKPLIVVKKETKGGKDE